MTDIQISPERLAALDNITLDSGGHTSFQSGHCFNEAAAWLAGEPHSDAPDCVSPVLRRYTMRLNDRWDTEKRQTLKPFLPRVIGTAGDGKDELREQIATEFLTDRLLGPWLTLAGMTEELEQLEAMAGASKSERRDLLYAIREAAWAMRSKSRAALKAKVLERMKEQQPAVAAAAAATVNQAPLTWDQSYSAAYTAARKYYREHPLPISQEIADLAATQDVIALELLEAMIQPATVVPA